MIDQGILLAIAFVQDFSERKLMLASRELASNVAKLFIGVVPNKAKPRLSVMMMPFEIVTGEENKKEEVSVPEFKSLLMYVENTVPLRR